MSCIVRGVGASEYSLRFSSVEVLTAHFSSSPLCPSRGISPTKHVSFIWRFCKIFLGSCLATRKSLSVSDLYSAEGEPPSPFLKQDVLIRYEPRYQNRFTLFTRPTPGMCELTHASHASLLLMLTHRLASCANVQAHAPARSKTPHIARPSRALLCFWPLTLLVSIPHGEAGRQILRYRAVII